MNGAESLVTTLLESGIDTCFANPGTSEMHFVAALDQIPGMRCVLGLQENIVTGMADGYYRIAGKPASTLLHCGAGLANGWANLHNARRANSGIVNIVGDQATYHHPFDAPLTADTAGLASAVSRWVRTSRHAADVGRDAAAAVAAARTAPDRSPRSFCLRTPHGMRAASPRARWPSPQRPPSTRLRSRPLQVSLGAIRTCSFCLADTVRCRKRKHWHGASPARRARR